MRVSHWLALVVAFAATGCGTNPPPTPSATLAPAVPLAADQRVENPAYTRWAAAAPGTMVTYTSATDVSGQVTRGKYMQRLITRNEGAAEVESVDLNTADGKPVGEPQTLKQLRWMGKPGGKGDADPARPAGTYATGEETLTVNGKEYRTRWYKFKGHVEAGETDTQTWYAADVPGGLVKSVHAIPAIKKTVTTELAEVKTP